MADTNNIVEYAVRMTADVDQFNNNLKSADQQLELTQKQAGRFAKKMEEALNSADPSIAKNGRAMQALLERYAAAMQQFRHFGDQTSMCGAKLRELTAAHSKQQAAISETEARIQDLEQALHNALRTQNAMKEEIAEGHPVKETAHARIEKEVRAAKAALDEERASLESQKAALDATESSMAKYGELASENARFTEEYGNAALDAKSQVVAMIRGTFDLRKIGGIMKTAAVKTKDFAVAMAKAAGAGVKKVVDGVKNLVGRFKEAHLQSGLLTGATHKLVSTFGSFSNMLSRIIKRQVIMRVLDALKTGIQGVAQESAPFNNAVSRMGSAALQFTNQIGAAFAPLIQIVAPVITTLIKYLTAGLDAFSQFTARITGASTYKRALPVAYDYAAAVAGQSKSADKASKATDKQTKSLEKLKRTILGFDQLHTLSDDSSDTSNTSTDTSTADSGDVTPKFMDAAISDKIGSFADKLLKAFKKGDWSGLGKAMAAGINKAFAWVDDVVKWDNAGQTITRICEGITGTLNSLVANIDAPLIGKTLGDFVNTIINTISLLQTGIDWGTIGSQFGAGVKSLFDTVDWAGLGQVFINHFQNLLYIVQGFVSTPDIFASIGTAIRDSIAGMVDAIDPTAWGDTAAKLFNGIFEALGIAFSDFKKYEELGSKLAANVNTFIGQISAKDFGTGVSNFVLAILSGIIGFIETTDWYEVGKKIADCVAAINWVQVADKLFEAIGAALAGLGLFLVGLIEPAWKGMIDWWYKQAFKDGQFSITGLLKGILDVMTLSFVWSWIYEHVFKPISDGICKSFDINGHSKKMADLGDSIASGLLDGIKEIGADIIKWFFDLPGEIFDAISDIGNDMFDVGAGIMNSLADGLSSIHIPLPHFDVSWDWLNSAGGGFSLPKIGIDWYARGGFPEDGLFMANHNELVGEFSNGRTAVANNEQITAGITNAVSSAVIPALLQIMQKIDDNGRGGPIVLQANGRVIAEIVNDENRRFAGYKSVPVGGSI